MHVSSTCGRYCTGVVMTSKHPRHARACVRSPSPMLAGSQAASTPVARSAGGAAHRASDPGTLGVVAAAPAARARVAGSARGGANGHAAASARGGGGGRRGGVWPAAPRLRG